MPCYHPLTAFKIFQPYPLKSRISFSSGDRGIGTEIKLPCGQCVGCRLERSRQWAIRCSHEASLYSANCFITLTYNRHFMPDSGSLDVRDFQLFMKKLRKRFSGVDDVVNSSTGEVTKPIRFFHCGEYGEQYKRPHYHACLFNFDFPDKKLWRRTKQGHMVWRSPALEELWPYGYCEIGAVTFESAAYVARYIMKKVNGDGADDHYMTVDPATGEIRMLKPEYVTMSRRPGIGHGWYEKYKDDVYPSDEVVMRGRLMKPPRYYDRQLQIDDGFTYDEIKSKREDLAKLNLDDNTSKRLLVKEQVALARISKLKRSID